MPNVWFGRMLFWAHAMRPYTDMLYWAHAMRPYNGTLIRLKTINVRITPKKAPHAGGAFRLINLNP